MDIVATRSAQVDESCESSGASWSGAFTTEAGGEVKICMQTVPKAPALHGTLGPACVTVKVTYIDKLNYFDGAKQLFPYISLLKTKYPNQGEPLICTDGGTRIMDIESDGTFEATFDSDLDNDFSFHQEMVSGLTMAFTAAYPYSGQAKWDSNGHKNHGFWLR
jgi:hypothetical protein